MALLAGCGGDGGGSPREAGGGQGDRGTYRGGEKSIEEFGEEASGSTRTALFEVFHGYLRALSGRDYETACSHLAAKVHRSLKRLADGGSNAGCTTILPGLLAPTAALIAQQQDQGRITRVRAADDRAFVVFRAPGAELYHLTMERERGDWKTATLAASVLVPASTSPVR